MGVSKNRGGPPKWMVKIMENPIEIDDLGVPLFLQTPIYCDFSLCFFLLMRFSHELSGTSISFILSHAS